MDTLYSRDLCVDTCKKLVVALTGFRQHGNDSFAASQKVWEEAGWHTIYQYLPDHESEQQLRRGRPMQWDEILCDRILDIWEKNGKVPIALAAFSMGAPAVERFHLEHPDKIECIYYAAPARRLNLLFHVGQTILLLLNWILRLSPLLACAAAADSIIDIRTAVGLGVVGFLLHIVLGRITVPTIGLPNYEWAAVGTSVSLYKKIPLMLAARLQLLMIEMGVLSLFKRPRKIRTLIVHGAKDWVVPISVSQAMVNEDRDHVQLLPVADAKHDVLVTHWPEIGPSVRVFFETPVSKELSDAQCKL